MSSEVNDETERINLDRARRGDPAGLEYLMEENKDMAFTIALKIVNTREDAEEVVQDSFLKAFSAIGTFRGSASFSTWFYRIVYNTSLTKIKRKRIVTSPISGIDLERKSDSRDTSTWSMLKEEERKRYVNDALRKLNYLDGTIITLYYVGDNKLKKIAEIMDLKESAVKMRLLRAREKLKAELETLLGNELENLL